MVWRVISDIKGVEEKLIYLERFLIKNCKHKDIDYLRTSM